MKFALTVILSVLSRSGVIRILSLSLSLVRSLALVVLWNALVRACLFAFISSLSHSNTSVGLPRRRCQTQQIIYPNRLRFCTTAALLFQLSFTCKFRTHARAFHALQQLRRFNLNFICRTSDVFKQVTHTHTHTHRVRGRERRKDGERVHYHLNVHYH